MPCLEGLGTHALSHHREGERDKKRVADGGFGEDGVGPTGCQAGMGSWVTLSLLPSHWQQPGFPLHFLQSILIDSGCWATNSGEPHRRLRLRHSFGNSSRERGWCPPSPSSSRGSLTLPRMPSAAPQGSFTRKRKKPLLMQQGEEVGRSPHPARHQQDSGEQLCFTLTARLQPQRASSTPGQGGWRSRGKPTQARREVGETGWCSSLPKSEAGLTLWFSRQAAKMPLKMTNNCHGYANSWVQKRAPSWSCGHLSTVPAITA